MADVRAPRRPASVHDAWIVAAVTFLVLTVIAGVRATPGVLMVSLEAVAVFAAGAIRTVAGGYELAFWIAGILCVFAGLAFPTVGRTTWRVAPPIPATVS